MVYPFPFLTNISNYFELSRAQTLAWTYEWPKQAEADERHARNGGADVASCLQYVIGLGAADLITVEVERELVAAISSKDGRFLAAVGAYTTAKKSTETSAIRASKVLSAMVLTKE